MQTRLSSPAGDWDVAQVVGQVQVVLSVSLKAITLKLVYKLGQLEFDPRCTTLENTRKKIHLARPVRGKSHCKNTK